MILIFFISSCDIDNSDMACELICESGFILDEITNQIYKIKEKTHGISFARYYDQIYYEN